MSNTQGAKTVEILDFGSDPRLSRGTREFLKALNSPAPEPYTSATMGEVDVEEWMRIFATEHIIINFDAYGHEIGKNMYAFKPDGGKWQFSKNNLPVNETRKDILPWINSVRNPGVPFSTRKPRITCFLLAPSSASTLAQTTATSQTVAFPIHILRPSST